MGHVMGLMDVVRTAVSAVRAFQTRVEVIGHNIANVDTPAFKSSRTDFSMALYRTTSLGVPPAGELGGVDPIQVGGGVRVASTPQDWRQGALELTGIDTDLAIVGRGFFVLRDESGGRVYTRAGGFGIGADGQLFDRATGFAVESVAVPSGSGGDAVAASVAARSVSVSRSVRVSQAPVLADFANPHGLLALGHSYFRATPASGPARVGAPGIFGRGSVHRGALEQSNVDLTDQLTALIVAQRAFQANARMVKIADELLEELLNLI